MKAVFVKLSAVVLVGLGCTFDGARVVNSTAGKPLGLTAQQARSPLSGDLNELILKLSSGNARERAEAACSLGEARAVVAIPALVTLLRDDAQVDQPVAVGKIAGAMATMKSARRQRVRWRQWHYRESVAKLSHLSSPSCRKRYGRREQMQPSRSG